MCIVFIDSGTSPHYKLVILSNRDEAFQRPTLRSHYWTPTSLTNLPSPDPATTTASSSLHTDQSQSDGDNQPSTSVSILGGRDAIRGGTWLGISTNGRFAVLTNFQEKRPPPEERILDGRSRRYSHSDEARSRGDLPTAYLMYETIVSIPFYNSSLLSTFRPLISCYFPLSPPILHGNAGFGAGKWGSMTADEYLDAVRSQEDDYPGFNLIVGDTAELRLYSNRDPTRTIESCPQGSVLGLTNGLINPPWYKAARGVQLLRDVPLPHPDQIAEQAKLSDFSATNSEPNKELLELLNPLFDILQDTYPPPSDPATDAYSKAGMKAPIFVPAFVAKPDPVAPIEYGTRCSIVILVDSSNRVTFYEKALDVETRQWLHRAHHFEIK